MFTETDLELFAQKGIAPEQVEEQLQRFATGFPYLKIYDVARTGHGITTLTPEQEQAAIERWHAYLAQGGEVCKFVPASGAASRMFKALFEFVDSAEAAPAAGSPIEQLINNIHKFAFYPDLDKVCKELYNADVDALLRDGRYKDIVAAIIQPQGLNYGALPKGLLKFHSYAAGNRTPVEEQLVEGAQTAANSTSTVNLHFTVSTAHRRLFEVKLAEVIPGIEKERGVKFNVTLSEQKPSTDTVAANPDGTPFMEDGHMLFRPGGHGALIQNLNDIEQAVVFIKNIDNVVPDSCRQPTIKYKEILAGYLMELHDKVEKYLRDLGKGDYTRGYLQDMLRFLQTKLGIHDRKVDGMTDTQLAVYIHGKLSRPLRVCGMVRNEGEPGGGPFIAYNPDGSASPQILESTQIDPANAEYTQMLKGATHFNPVDLVCYIKDIHGQKYNLPSYVDPDTGFISSKSSHGKELRAMELPGLWNGAMSDWNTAFVEVPVDTFNPVKTVNDLLRPAHQQ